MIKEEAIEILSDMRAEYNIFSDDEEEATRYHALSWAIQALNECKTGKWDTECRTIHGHKFPVFACSKCGKESIDEYKFCPNCGADMRQDELDADDVDWYINEDREDLE